MSDFLNKNTSPPTLNSKMVRPKIKLGKHMFKALSLLVFVFVAVPLLTAFEAHLVNVTASFADIDPPILTLPGDVPVGDTTGGVGLSGNITVTMTAPDTDATHIYYTFGPGTDPATIPDPACGNSGSQSGGGPKNSNINISFSQDTTIKAIACDGSNQDSHRSVINIKRYFFVSTPPPTSCSDTPFDVLGDFVLLTGGNSLSDVEMKANAKVMGNTHSNGAIGPSQPPLTRKIVGNASAVGQVHNAIQVTGTRTNGDSTKDLPNINQNLWKLEAKNHQEIPGDLVFPANSGNENIGPASILGDLVIGNNNQKTITGPLHIAGNLEIKSNSTIYQASEQESKITIIIVDGQIIISPNVSFQVSGNGAFLIISNSEAQPGTESAIDVGANGSLEHVILLATQGDVRLQSNAKAGNIFALKGSSAGDAAVRLEPNSSVTGPAFKLLIVCGAGQNEEDEDDDDEEDSDECDHHHHKFTAGEDKKRGCKDRKDNVEKSIESEKEVESVAPESTTEMEGGNAQPEPSSVTDVSQSETQTKETQLPVPDPTEAPKQPLSIIKEGTSVSAEASSGESDSE